MLRKLIASASALMLVAGSAFAGLRGPGKYTGIVVFDRWDTCYLYSGIYLMYISGKTKEALRKYEGHSILLDAKEVYQPFNPGDGRIGKFKVLKVLSTNKQPDSTGLFFTVRPQFQNGNSKLVIEIKNTGRIYAHVSTGAFALTLLGIKQESLLSPSDGKSPRMAYASTIKDSFLCRRYDSRFSKEYEDSSPHVEGWRRVLY